MSDGEGVWAHLVCEQTMLATGKSFQMGVGCAWLSKRVWLSFQRATVVEKGVVGFSNGHGCRNGHGWVFEQAWLLKRAGWVFK